MMVTYLQKRVIVKAPLKLSLMIKNTQKLIIDETHAKNVII